MDEILACPTCHIVVRLTDYFCFNCGTNLHPKPLPTTLEAQLILYIKCLVLLPFGAIWGMRYLRQMDQKSRLVGLVAIGITVLATFLATYWTIQAINQVNAQVNDQMRVLQGLY